MRRVFLIFLGSLASLFPLVSACGAEGHEGEVVGNGIIGFGFFGGVVSALVVIVIILGVMLSLRKNGK